MHLLNWSHSYGVKMICYINSLYIYIYTQNARHLISCASVSSFKKCFLQMIPVMSSLKVCGSFRAAASRHFFKFSSVWCWYWPSVFHLMKLRFLVNNLFLNISFWSNATNTTPFPPTLLQKEKKDHCW